MKLVVGLGNPGKEYEQTRHNVGFVVVEKLADKLEFKPEKKFEAQLARQGEILLVKPTTFMNNSGRAMAKLVNFYRIKPEDLWIIHDDLDLRLGGHKIQWGKGPKVHQGAESVEKALGRSDFWRARVGVDNRENREMAGKDYVLGKFREDELPVIERVTGELAKELAGRLE